jgi:hypothetical protein
VETEGPQTNEGNGLAPQEPNVVQLGDWIGPRDDLVPFGRRPRVRSSEHPPVSETRGGAEFEAAASRAEPATPDPPPSAEDFWGERAAAIHHALQAPVEGRQPAGTGDEGDSDTEPTSRPPRSTNRPRVGDRIRRPRSLAAAACLAVLALAGLAVALNPLGAGTSHNGAAGGSKLPLASVLSSGVSRALSRDVPRIGGTIARTRTRVTGSAGIRRHPAHTRPRLKPEHPTTPARTTVAVSLQPAAGAYTARAASPAPTPTETSNRPAPSANSPEPKRTSTSGPVSATGASGALGPIQSPNG